MHGRLISGALQGTPPFQVTGAARIQPCGWRYPFFPAPTHRRALLREAQLARKHRPCRCRPAVGVWRGASVDGVFSPLQSMAGMRRPHWFRSGAPRARTRVGMRARGVSTVQACVLLHQHRSSPYMRQPHRRARTCRPPRPRMAGLMGRARSQSLAPRQSPACWRGPWTTPCRKPRRRGTGSLGSTRRRTG